MPSSRPDRGRLLYEEPRLYDLAFSFRDVPAECDGLLAIAAEHGRREPRSVVELACGPGHHAREFAARGLRAFGVDTSPDMLGYADALCRASGASVTFRRADMRAYRLPAKVDLAMCLFDSFTHCTSTADGVAALRATADALRPGGLFVLELTHPADHFARSERRTVSSWTQRHPDVTVTARYGISNRNAVDETYVATLDIRARYRDRRRPRRVVNRQLHRMWLRSGIENIAARSAAFDVAAWYGDLETQAPLSMGLSAWRMIAVLRRR